MIMHPNNYYCWAEVYDHIISDPGDEQHPLSDYIDTTDEE